MGMLMGKGSSGLLGKRLARNEEKYASSEAPGFSGTMVQDENGKWVSIDAGKEEARKRGRRRIVKQSVITGLA
jgi:hypothetical protein